MGTFTSAVEAFRELHRAGCFLMPNPWDVGSARYLTQQGFKALATTSAGFAFSRGLPDTVTALSVEDVLKHLQEIVGATDLPVNADFQAGYSDTAEGVATNVARCVRTGVAGLSIEDASGERATPLFARNTAVERVKAARRAIDQSGSGVVLTARCEAFLVGHPDPEREAVERFMAYADAGADCLFAPAVRDPSAIERIVKAAGDTPVNVVVSSHIPELSVGRLRDLGVRRISIGSGLARVAWGGFMRAIRDIAETGRFDALAGAASFADLNRAFSD